MVKAAAIQEEDDNDDFSKPPPIPKAEPIALPTPQDMMQAETMNNCGVRTVLSTVMGGGMGVLMGIAFAGFDPVPVDETGMTTRQKVVSHFRQMGSRSYTMAKTFAVMGALFSGSECARAKHDIWNSVYAGCFTGGAISVRSGPKTALVGCAGFAAFSAAIDKIMDRE
eukprot:jgi/Chlat1/6339/Chrsp44S05904